ISIGVHGDEEDDRFATVADTRIVDGVEHATDLREVGAGPRAQRLEERGLLVGHHRHRAPLGMPKPATAMISRWISLTPPPNVSTKAERSASSTSPRKATPGEPGDSVPARPMTSSKL